MENEDRKKALVDVLNEVILQVQASESVNAFLNVDGTVGSKLTTVNIKIVMTEKA